MIDKMKTFCTLMEHKTLVEAAKVTKLSVSGVQRQITALEKEVGVKLFEKQNKLLKATHDGDVFYQHCLKILAKYEAALQEVGKKPDELMGELTINATTSSVASFLVSDLSQFIRDNPKIRFVIAADDRPIRQLKSECDVFIRPKDSDSPEYEQKFLKTFFFKLYASKDYIKNHGRPETIEDLNKHRIIVYDKISALWFNDMNWHLSSLPKDYRDLVFINSGLGILKAIEGSVGIGVISDYGSSENDALVDLFPSLPPYTVDIHLIYPKNSLKRATIEKLHATRQ